MRKLFSNKWIYYIEKPGVTNPVTRMTMSAYEFLANFCPGCCLGPWGLSFQSCKFPFDYVFQVWHLVFHVGRLVFQALNLVTKKLLTWSRQLQKKNGTWTRRYLRRSRPPEPQRNRSTTKNGESITSQKLLKRRQHCTNRRKLQHGYRRNKSWPPQFSDPDQDEGKGPHVIARILAKYCYRP